MSPPSDDGLASAQRERPWWLWPNLLGLDAPVVAVVWQRFLADELQSPVSWLTSGLLGLAVWLIYVGDHWFDARRLGPNSPERHRLFAHYRRPVAAVLVFASVAGLVVAAWRLPAMLAGAGGLLFLVVVGYFLLHHGRTSPSHTRPGAKETSVGVLFAIGVGLPLLVADPTRADVVLALTLFAVLAALNCWCITRWESPESVGRLVFVGGSAGLLLVGGGTATPVVLAGCLALLTLVSLDQFRQLLSPNALRVLADVALLSPLLVEAVQ